MTNNQIVFIDDDPKAGELLLRFSEDAHFDCHVFQDPVVAMQYLQEHVADLVITDLRMPGMSGMEVLSHVRELDAGIPVIMVTGYSTVESAIEAMRLGATDFIKKPFDMDELRVVVEKTLAHVNLEQENRLLRRQLSDERNRYDMIGHSPAMQQIYATIDKIADIRCNVVIEGESGSGKELAARAIHNQGSCADKPFIVIDCGSLSDTLLESELFGHEKGAFTGAVGTKQGLLETAPGGTVFLDEISNISDAMQVKLLRVIQERQIIRVGGVTPIPIDVRFVVASNQNLEAMVADGSFRHDLYHRLNVVKIRMPGLRERREDIPMLTQHFVEYFADRYQRDVKGFDAESMERLCEYDWPGNVRELSNLVERHVALAEEPTLHAEPLTGLPVSQTIDMDLPTLAELERRYIFKLLAKFNDNREKTAAALGINKSTLWRKLQQYAAKDTTEAHAAGTTSNESETAI
jgi:DNA-binding NtrC family response regulator